MQKELTPNKGKKYGNCNVTHCQTPRLVLFFNTSTNAYYCYDCCTNIRNACEEIKDEIFPNFKVEMKEYISKLDD